MSRVPYQQPIECADPETVEIKHRCHLHRACAAATESPDRSTKNGAVLVSASGRTVVWDCNRFSILGDTEEGEKTTGQVALESVLLDDRERKLAWIEHAETNVIFSAVRMGLSPVGAILYCPFASCDACARAIVLCGVRELVRLPESAIPWPERWRKSIVEGDRILAAGGVKITEYVGPQLGHTYLVDGKEYAV